MTKVRFLGACRGVGRSSFWFFHGNLNVLLDAGMDVGAEGESRYPLLDDQDIPRLDFLIVSHAHLDHSGYIPYMVKHGFKGIILCTRGTRDVMELLWLDAARIGKENKDALYGEKDVTKTLKRIRAVEYHQHVRLGKGVGLEFLNAGHILGSALVVLEFDGKKFVYTGDFSGKETHLFHRFERPPKTDFLMMECTYAGTDQVLPSTPNASHELAKQVKKALERKGSVLIPVFAVGRGQEIMLALAQAMESGFLPRVPIWLDGMINKATDAHVRNVLQLRESIAKRILLAKSNPFKAKFFRVPSSKEKREVFAQQGIVLATSGMLTGGPARLYLERFAPDARNMLILVGYQAHGSLGRTLAEGARMVEIRKRVGVKRVHVRMDVQSVHFSGHADYPGLVNFVREAQPKTVFLVHGEHKKMEAFKGVVEKKFKARVLIPYLGQTVPLEGKGF
ncbi:MAG: MBL fold metallo-hydrolase [Candidatus Diapherotrites archaeon]|nr:MBL fold metallo-hydrolase [Candidatus Diapherotrites archaeon]